MANEISITKANDQSITITITDRNDNVVDLTGGTLFFTVKEKLEDADVDALIATSVNSFAAPTTGVAVITLTKTQTDIAAGAYYYDTKFKDSSGKYKSSGVGRFVVNQGVTIRTS